MRGRTDLPLFKRKNIIGKEDGQLFIRGRAYLYKRTDGQLCMRGRIKDKKGGGRAI